MAAEFDVKHMGNIQWDTDNFFSFFLQEIKSTRKDYHKDCYCPIAAAQTSKVTSSLVHQAQQEPLLSTPCCARA